MKPQIRTTAALLGAAGTFVAAAVLLDRNHAGASSKAATASDPKASAPPKGTCGVAGDAKATAKASSVNKRPDI